MKRKITLGIATAAAGIAALSATACSSAPPTAGSILSGDGYSPISNTLLGSGTLASIAPYESSLAFGTNPAGNIEAVIVLNSAGKTQVTPDDVTLANAGGTGVHLSLNGDVLKMDGSVAAFSSASTLP